MAWWIFQNLIVTAVLAALVWIVCRIGRIGPVGRHALWAIVLVKFVTPPVVVWPWAAPDPLGVAALDARADRPPAPGPTSIGADRSPLELSAAIAGTGDDATRVAIDGGGPKPASIAPWLFGVWTAGSLVLLGIEGVRLARLGRRMRAARPADARIVDRVTTLSARLGLEPVPVREIDGLSAPLVWCVGRPRLLWPAGLAAEASDACVDGLLVHELAHVRRRDHFIGWIELVAGVVWWWNPLFWSVRSRRRDEAELACDAWVIDVLPHGRRAYAESLLALSIGPSHPSPASVLGIRAGTRRALERRLVMIMKGRASVRLPWLGLLALAFLAAATLPVWATAPGQTSQTQTPTPPPAKAPDVKPVLRTEPPTFVLETPASVRAVPIFAAQTQSGPAKTVAIQPVKTYTLHVVTADATKLPADGQDLLKLFKADRDAIEAEADKKIATRREALAKELQDLQERYTKTGKLEEAIAIRDFIRAGMPGADGLLRRVVRITPK